MFSPGIGWWIERGFGTPDAVYGAVSRRKSVRRWLGPLALVGAVVWLGTRSCHNTAAIDVVVELGPAASRAEQARLALSTEQGDVVSQFVRTLGRGAPTRVQFTQRLSTGRYTLTIELSGRGTRLRVTRPLYVSESSEVVVDASHALAGF